MTNLPAIAPKDWLLQQGDPKAVDFALQRSLTSALGVDLKPLSRMMFPKNGEPYDKIVGVEMALTDNADLPRAIERMQAAMTPASADEVEDWLTMMQAACAKRAESEDSANVALSLYTAALQQVPADVAKAACMHFATKRGTNWFPSLGELLEVTDRLTLPRQAMLDALLHPPPGLAIPKQRELKETRAAALAEVMAGYRVRSFEDVIAEAANKPDMTPL